MYKCQNTFINNNDIYLLKSYTSISYKPSKTQSVIVWVCKKPKYNFLLFSLRNTEEIVHCTLEEIETGRLYGSTRHIAKM